MKWRTTETRLNEEIIAKLRDLLHQASSERSHYYVAQTCREAIAAIERLAHDKPLGGRRKCLRCGAGAEWLE